MNPRISKITKTLHQEIKKRGPYNKQHWTRSKDDTAIGSTSHRNAPEGRPRSGHLLRLEWMHEMCQHKHAPAAWTRAIGNIDNLSNAAGEKARYAK